MYGLIHTETCRPPALSRASMPRGSGKVRVSQAKSHQLNSRIQNESKWKTLSGRSRSAIPWIKLVTVGSSYTVVKDVLSQSPNDQAGGRAGRPVKAVYFSRISFGLGP